MSDTVKLVIDFPKDKYKDFVACYCGNLNCDWLYKRVAEGIPLEDVKAEIGKPIQEECCYIGAAKIQADTIKWCLEILDSIGKEGEEKG